MYPQVFSDFDQFMASYGEVSGLPTTAFFYGCLLYTSDAADE